jgi:hypothetical protein
LPLTVAKRASDSLPLVASHQIEDPILSAWSHVLFGRAVRQQVGDFTHWKANMVWEFHEADMFH